jgi:hypothetical protein
LLGFVGGQTTNPSLIAKNPEIPRLIASGHRLRTAFFISWAIGSAAWVMASNIATTRQHESLE